MIQKSKFKHLWIFQKHMYVCDAIFMVIVGFTRIAVNFKFHSWFANFKLT